MAKVALVLQTFMCGAWDSSRLKQHQAGDDSAEIGRNGKD
jgi:hypothetical protein